MDNRLFREAMGKFATGITVVTTEYKNEVEGMTVNAFMSISLEPKLIAISIDEKAGMYHTLQETKQFGISILSKQQQELSMIFAKQKGNDTTVEYDYKDNNPVLRDALATLSCYTKEAVKAGDHMIFIAQVTNVEINSGEPILYFDSQYRELK